MLKKRIIANLTLLNGIVVQSKGFNKYLPIGKPEIAVEFLNQWGIDEIIISDISASSESSEPLLICGASSVEYSSVNCSSPGFTCFRPVIRSIITSFYG